MIPDRLSWSVALNGLWDSKRLTALTMVVVSVSVVLVIFLSALIDGLRVKLVAETTSAIPHVVVSPLERRPMAPSRLSTPGRLVLGARSVTARQRDKLEDWRRLVGRVERARGVEAAAASVEGMGFASVGERRESARIVGARPERYDRVVAIARHLTAGRFTGLAPGEVVIGEGLAGALGVGVGDRLRVNASTGAAADARVAGIYSTGFGALDDATVFVTLSDGQSLFGLGSSVSAIGVRVSDVFEAERVAREVRRRVGHRVRPWTQENQRLLGVLEAQARSSHMITFFTAVAATFAIASILIVLVTNKLGEIGILKAMGATRRQIQTIFALQGTMLSTLGAALGCALGALLVLGLGRIEVVRPETGRPEELFPFELTASLIVATLAAAALIGFLASMIPARHAARVDPIEVIRG